MTQNQIVMKFYYSFFEETQEKSNMQISTTDNFYFKSVLFLAKK